MDVSQVGLELQTPPPRRITFRRRAADHLDSEMRWYFAVGPLSLMTAGGLHLLRDYLGGALPVIDWVLRSCMFALGIFGGFFTLFILGIAGVGGIVALALIPRSALLVRYGMPAIAEIVDRSEKVGADDGPIGFIDVYLSYAFTTADGERIEVKELGAPDSLKDCRIGDRFTVLYAPRRPKLHEPYLESFFRERPASAPGSAGAA
jgi:hypothetical protein